MKVVITIPTYNEVENIERVLTGISEVSKTMLRHDFYVLVIDGNSPDGTADVVKGLSNRLKNIKLIVEEEKNGLGAAYILGFKHAMNIMSADVIIEMDGDLQHDPKDVARLVGEIDNGADYVIGSRFMSGGSIPKEWAFYRKFLSRGGSIFSKILLGIPNINDFTSGFKATRVKGFLDKLDLDQVQSKGFAYKIDLLYKMHKLGAKIVEIPIEFGLRDRGSSKMEMSNLFESFWLVIKMRAKESQNLLLFLLVGTIGFTVDIFVFNTFVFLSSANAINVGTGTLTPNQLASLVSGFIAMFVTYTLNNYWTFSDNKKSTASEHMLSVVVYYFSSYIPILLRSWFVGFMVSRFGNNFLINNIAFLTGVAFGLVWNFTVYSKVIWKNKGKNEN